MVPKIITHAASVFAQNKKDLFRVLGRGARSKSKRHSPQASLSGSSTNMPPTCLERRSRTAQNNRTQGYVAHFRKNHHRLLLGHWNVFNLTGKKLELVEETNKYHHLHIVLELLLSGIVDLDGRWKLFYSAADLITSAQAVVGILKTFGCQTVRSTGFV